MWTEPATESIVPPFDDATGAWFGGSDQERFTEAINGAPVDPLGYL